MPCVLWSAFQRIRGKHHTYRKGFIMCRKLTHRYVRMICRCKLSWPANCINELSTHLAVGQNQCYHFGVGAPPILVYFSGDRDVHWGYRILTHSHLGAGPLVHRHGGNVSKTSQSVGRQMGGGGSNRRNSPKEVVSLWFSKACCSSDSQNDMHTNSWPNN